MRTLLAATSACLVGSSACVVDLAGIEDVEIRCFADSECPLGRTCEETIGRCRLEGAAAPVPLTPTADLSGCMAPLPESGDFVCARAFEERFATVAEARGCLVVRIDEGSDQSIPVQPTTADGDQLVFGALTIPEDLVAFAGDGTTARLFLLRAEALTDATTHATTCASFALHSDCLATDACLASFPPQTTVIDASGELTIRYGVDGMRCGVECNDPCDPAGGERCTRLCYVDRQAPVEVCDGLDNDCDGGVDEGLTPTLEQCPGGCLPSCGGAEGWLCHDVPEQSCANAVTKTLTPVPIDWVEICGGCFQMGSDVDNLDERPMHEVTVPAFEIMQLEVTVGDYRACVDAGACGAPIDVDGIGVATWSAARCGLGADVCEDCAAGSDCAGYFGGLEGSVVCRASADGPICIRDCSGAYVEACSEGRSCEPAGPGISSCLPITGPCTPDYPDAGDCEGEHQPVNYVSWDQAQAFAAWVGGGARLCSEAEWEYAARAGGQFQHYPWGDEPPTCDRAIMENGRDREGCDRWHTWPVGSKPAGATAQGVIDLAGNVLEWVQDRYNLDYTGAPEDGSAWTATGANRVTRGGGWYRTADTLRAVERDFHSPVFGHLDVGIRLCR